jgi:hypothetical protein
MVGEELGELTPAFGRPAFDPSRHDRVGPRAFPSREALVRNILDQDVPERGFPFTDDRRARMRVNEPPLLEPDEDLAELDGARTRLEELMDRSVPERPADHGGRLQDALLDRRQQVDPSGEHTLNRVRDLQVLGVRGVVQEALHDLLEEEGVPSRAFDDERAEVVRHRTSLNEEVEELGRFIIGEWLEEQARVVPPPTAPLGAAGRELGPRRTHEQQRSLTPLGRVLQKVEQRGIRPVDVLDDHDHGSRSGEGGEERDPCGSEVIANLPGITRRPREARILETDRVREPRTRSGGIRGYRPRDQLLGDLVDLLEGEIGRIGVEDAGL